MVRVTVLGSGDAYGSGGRAHSAYLVEAPGTTFLVDCGATVLQSLKRAGRDPNDIDFVIISHLHGDHFGGLPFLFMEYRYERPRRRPITIYGPVGTERRVRMLFTALYEKTAAEASPFPIAFQEIVAGVGVTVGGLQIAPFAVPHVHELMCLAYRFELGGRSILYSGDAAWTDEFLARARGVDLFLCECSTYETRLDIHISYPEIAARASALGCRRLLLTHLGSETLRHRAELTLECAEDGQTIEL
jgi:ribonuclease BN (tRNA processing enzyme)